MDVMISVAEKSGLNNFKDAILVIKTIGSKELS